MSKLKLVVIDDEPNVREAIERMVKLYCPEVEITGSADSVALAVNIIEKQRPDVILLDINMKVGNGFDVLKHFPSPFFKIIFITAYEEYAVRAFRFSALDYLLKPLDPDQLASAIQKAQDAIDKSNVSLKISSFLYNIDQFTRDAKKVVLKTADSIHVINLQDVMYCEADRSYTSFYLNDKTRIMVSVTLGDYEEMFGDHGFLRVHQSYLVNLRCVKRYEKADGLLFLSGNVSIPVSTRKKDQLLTYLKNL